LARQNKKSDAEAYRKFVIDTGIREYNETEGNLGAQLWQRDEGDITHIWTISRWNSYESIKKFAGEEIETPKYYEEDKRYLLEFEPTVIHCETYHFPKQ
jgi:phosphorylcholine metabolism protein LicD